MALNLHYFGLGLRISKNSLWFYRAIYGFGCVWNIQYSWL